MLRFNQAVSRFLLAISKTTPKCGLFCACAHVRVQYATCTYDMTIDVIKKMTISFLLFSNFLNSRQKAVTKVTANNAPYKPGFLKPTKNGSRIQKNGWGKRM